MSECRDFRERLSAALDQPLPAPEAAQLQAHVAGCPDCRRFQQALARARELLRDLPQADPPPWLTARVMDRVRAQAAPRPAWWRRPHLQAAAVLLLCASTYLLIRPGSGPRAVEDRRDVQEERPAPAPPGAPPGEEQGQSSPAKARSVPAPVRVPPARQAPGPARGDAAREVAAPAAAEGFAPVPAAASGATRANTAPPRPAEPVPAPAPAASKGDGTLAHGFAGGRAAPAPQRRLEAVAKGLADQAESGLVRLRWAPRDPDLADSWLEEALAGLEARPEARTGRSLEVRLEVRRLPELRARLARRGPVEREPGPDPAPDTLVVRVQIRW